jgi:hypothetical protein
MNLEFDPNQMQAATALHRSLLLKSTNLAGKFKHPKGKYEMAFNPAERILLDAFSLQHSCLRVIRKCE